MKKNKLLKYILSSSLIIAFSFESCYAKTLGFLNQLTDSNGSSSGKPKPIEFEKWADYPESNGDRLYQYRYKKEINTATYISMNAYDLDGNSVIPNSIEIDKEEYAFKAGTWVGINVTEIKNANYKVYDFEYKEIKKEYTCKYKKASTSYSCCKGAEKYIGYGSRERCGTVSCSRFAPKTTYASGTTYGYCYAKELSTCTTSSDTRTSNPVTRPYYEQYTCPKTYPGNSAYKLTETIVEEKEVNVTDNSVISSMKNSAITSIQNIARSYVTGGTSSTVKYTKDDSSPNSGNEEPAVVGDSKNEIFSKKLEENKPKETSGVVSGSYTQEHEILQPTVCMDVKTAKVTYGRKSGCNKDEISVENGKIYDKHLKRNVNYWHYFIPLNAFSDEDFSIEVVKNGDKVFSIEDCETFMQNNLEDYIKYITPLEEYGTFIGDYGIYENKRYSVDLQKVKQGKGCNISTKISFPISQEFYSEVEKQGTIKEGESQYKLKGFNFYYKPIDVNNPFPNGLSSNSLWNEWNKNQNTNKENPNLSESFKSKTYVSTNINAKAIREYNKSNQYADWTNMYTTGVSKFIESQGIVTRLVDTDSFYKLGCGPANKDWEECKKS